MADKTGSLAIFKSSGTKDSNKMITVSLYAIQPILAAGFRTFMDGIGGIEVPEVYIEIEVLRQQIPVTNPDVVVLEVTPAITLDVLAALVSLDVPIILWSSAISPEFASQALAYGVRGMLSTTATRNDYAQCLIAVQSGGRWVERDLGSKLLGHRRVSLSPRQRQMMGLVAKGLRNKEIAYAMGISEGTVKVYMSKLFQRVGVSDRFELALLVLRNLAGDQLGATQQVAAAKASVDPFVMPAFLTTDRSVRLGSGY